MNTGRFRLGLVLFAPLAAVAALLVVLVPARLNSAAMQAAHQRAAAVASVLARASAPAVDFEDAQAAREVLETISDDPEVTRAALRDSDGHLLAWLPPGERTAADALPRAATRTTRTAEHHGELVVFAPVVGRGNNPGSLVVSMSLAGVAEQRSANLTITLLVAGITLAVGVAFSLIASSFLLRRRRAEEALHRSERNLREIIEASPDAMLVHRDGRIAYVNPAARRMLASGDHVSLSGKEIDSVVPAAPRPDAPLSEMTLSTPAGPVTCEVRSLNIAWDSAPAFLIIARDVTEVRRMQTQLLLSDRMASVGTLAAGVAHEINNPLSFVLANITFAADTLKAQRGVRPEADEILGALDDAHQGAERVSRIVRDLKTFSRADDERRVPVSLHAALDLSLQMTNGVVRHRARVVKHYGPVPLVFATDSRLGQVFVNLLVNAAQALPDDGKQHLIEVSTQTDYAGRAVVAIRDTGAGIHPEILKRIFDPFFTTKPIGVGTGLGLSICHNIIHSLGGEIAVHSRLGAGTTFTVTLPGATGAAPVVETPTVVTAKHPQRRGRVLVVDDEPLIAQAVRRTLELDADVIAETSAVLALSRFQRGEKFDVILCDLMMPEMTGMDLHAALTREHSDQLDRLVFVTGAVFPGPARQFLSEAHRPHIEKPFDPAGLRKMVNSYFEVGRLA